MHSAFSLCLSELFALAYFPLSTISPLGHISHTPTTLSSSEFILSDFSASNDSESLASYHFKKEHYKILISKYDKIVRKFDEINALIQKTIFDVNQFYIKRFDTHFYDILLILQKKMFSFDYERLMIIEANYHRIRKNSKNQDVER